MTNKMKKQKQEFNENPPLRKATKKYIILRDKGNGVVFWTSSSEYRIDFYDLVFQSDDLDEVKDYYMKITYD